MRKAIGLLAGTQDFSERAVIQGKAGHKILVQFMPDIDKGTKGPTSTAETDAEGRLTLLLTDGTPGASRPGAVVCWHKVVLADLQLAES